MNPLIGKTYRTSTDQLLRVRSVQGETVILAYLNRPGKEDVTTTIIHLNKSVKLGVWKEE